MKEHKTLKQEGDSPELHKITVLGNTYFTTLTSKYKNRRRWVKPNEKELLSFIPGTIRQVLVKNGDTVTAGQHLLVLEAMKMMNTIHSPKDGIIRNVKVKEGDRLPKGTVMIEFE